MNMRAPCPRHFAVVTLAGFRIFRLPDEAGLIHAGDQIGHWLEVAYGHLNIDDGFCGKAGNRGRADVFDAQGERPKAFAQAAGNGR